MEKKELLEDYNRINRERLKLIKENNMLNQAYHDVLYSKAGFALRGFRKAERILIAKPKDAIKKALKRDKIRNNNLHSYISGSYQDNKSFFSNTDIKALAFYLPQYHVNPENDKWWGKGFMEWTNTKKAQPRYPGHYEPREPHDDFGYYELTNKDIFAKQIKLAKEHRIYGFCFYYYWFSGKRLLQKPGDIYLENKDLDFPFCLCWANGNWTRRWDGLDKEVLMEQKYRDDDAKNFIKDIKKYLEDERYIRVDGKPVILVYNPKEIPDYRKTIADWRETARKIGIGEIEVWSYRSLNDDDLTNLEFVDAEFDFAPNTFSLEIMDESHGGFVGNYEKVVDYLCDSFVYEYHHSLKPYYYSVTMDWDNSPRRAEGYFGFANYSPENFYRWTRRVVNKTRKANPEDRRFMFVNAWNEWAEGTYLEPDKKYGYLNINTFTKALLDLPLDDSVKVLNSKSEQAKTTGKIALQIHAFYTDVLEEAFERLKNFPYKLDLYISTDTAEKKKEIEELIKKSKLPIGKATVAVIENRGRDVYPFIAQMSKVYQKYDFVGHIHTKKSVENIFGNEWREYLYNGLIGTKDSVRRVFKLFEDEKVGIVFPAYYELLPPRIGMGSNLNSTNQLLERLGLKKVNKSDNVTFPAGSMFWARTEAIKDLFELGLTIKDFQEEQGQIDGTTAHALERVFGILPQQKGYDAVEYVEIPKR